jgi:sec-independent protein translocase protein TatC
MALDQVDVDKQSNMTFFEHLEVLRWHIMRSVIAIFVGSIVAFTFGSFIFDKILLGPTQSDFYSYQLICRFSEWLYQDDSLCVGDLNFIIQNLTLTGQFFQHLMIAFIGGLVIALPYMLFEVYRFVKPALKASERKYAGVAIGSGSLLFFTGLLFGYFVLVPVSVSFLGNYSLSEVIENKFTIESIIKFIAMLSVGAGMLFELPMVIYILAKVGLVSSAFLKKYRRMAIVVILVLSAIVTPPDVASQILLTFPIFLLYQFGISIAKRVEANNE